ncbi:hypothetical protein EUGRSUZ_L00350 [Eucalyptus grandis]|uniref:Fe2OG dioxygenase domain-containing protein n=1 Tax=Eucalyptus grandis TaxID=71139 RepID=A0A058ZWU4_EUCGR|nr:hypothetical protein EUGRSUZ_L00350 [Eucalyptus grandis]
MAPAAAKVLLTDLASGIDRVPDNYIRSEADRPNLTEVEASDASSIPLVDLQGLSGPNRDDIIRQIGRACQQDGFFQIKNHGIPEEKVQAIMNIAREFFRLPESERLKNYSDDPTKSTRLSTSFNLKTEKVSNWRDFLRLHCYPLEEYMHEWPTNPPSFRKEVGEYCTRVRELVFKLLEAISESLGLEREYISQNLGKHGQHMAMNYYPPCPQPELTYGLPGHTDPNLITILLQDDVPGLQVLRNGKWVAVNPIPNTFIVNIGDQMQVARDPEAAMERGANPQQRRQAYVEDSEGEEEFLDQPVHGGHRNGGYQRDPEQYQLKVDLPIFNGNLNIEDFLDWLWKVEKFFDAMEIEEDRQVKLVAYKLEGDASVWWEQTQLT